MYIDTTVEAPIKVDTTYDLTLKDLDLESLVDRLISILNDIKKKV